MTQAGLSWPSTSMVIVMVVCSAAGDLLDGGDLGAAPDPAADRHRAREADLAGAVVDPGRGARHGEQLRAGTGSRATA